MKEITRSELADFDGVDGAPAYVGFEGLVYDVSASYHWRGGKHWAIHLAGFDLTSALSDAPHGRELLSRFPVVGYLEQDDTRPGRPPKDR